VIGDVASPSVGGRPVGGAGGTSAGEEVLELSGASGELVGATFQDKLGLFGVQPFGVLLGFFGLSLLGDRAIDHIVYFLEAGVFLADGGLDGLRMDLLDMAGGLLPDDMIHGGFASPLCGGLALLGDILKGVGELHRKPP